MGVYENNAAITIDDRDIASLTLGPQSSGITISFADGSSVQEAFLAHKPPTKLNGPFAAQLRVELTPARDVKVTPPFGATSLKGVYAAGNCATAMKNAMQAMHMGTFAGVGIALDLQAEALIPRPRQHGRPHNSVTVQNSTSTVQLTPEHIFLGAPPNKRPRTAGQQVVGCCKVRVAGVGADATFKENALSQLNPLHKSTTAEPIKTIIDNSHGCVKPGEMLLVLGRPGSGCTTLLCVLANNRRGFKEAAGVVHYGNMTGDEAKQYRGQIIMNTEEEIFFPTLTVEATIDFASRVKVPPSSCPPGIATHDEYAQFYKEFLLRSVDISHTAHTKVGNAFIRGVSGRERKRVSILECLTTRASVYRWDNSTRGLDARTALDWIKAIRVMTDILGLSTIVTLYQAGNDIYEQFDKVLVLEEGKQI
ncbi:hypothetical protein G3M48_010308 [Beauveria asiatica]|uniref:ABC transporter domain-containing protein n=1 Tax=Beauveria asiatica TaxID=1069075 RepID=A0AAW0RHC2_9HYPO